MGETEDKIRTPQQDRSIRTKQAIVQAAMKLFSEKGYHQTNTKQIAAAAGVSTGSFYSYFIDKRAVFMEVLTGYSEVLLERIDSSMAEINFQIMDKHSLLTHLVDSLLLSHEVYTGFHKELSIMYLSDEDIKRQMDAQYEVGRVRTLQFLQMGKDELKVTDLEAAAILVFESVNAIVDVIAFSPHRVSPERLKRELVNMLVEYLYV
ncbi:TetR/AcrR family transcriptional regulator [Paenibacillus tianjinensis]|uniref:TetR/AcrR family transcriptional regulator n=1 Tax=Paenibacillus tianjinensis TaxID=2810347 RepID=A0ABX7LH03_9BACL|nr:TetR/AcrR family transcriptional regulator [Paenibacillus tianjinensis]QSF45775.1 TetR/AcrR family transcriptional regulator [Paenibacillus tianjinensis]